jgi:peptidoglycan hydrolase-like protein with peptidoglycan-binding domain
VSRRRVWLGVGAGALAVAITVAGTLGIGGRGAPPAAAPESPLTVEITKGPLARAATVEGTLGYGVETPISVRATGVVTWLPPEGTVVNQGETLLRVDDRPVVLLFGDLPMYRGLGETTPQAPSSPSTSSPSTRSPSTPSRTGAAQDPPTSAPALPPVPFKGRDVRQFESNLAVLGYRGFAVDDTFNAQTTAAVKRWQRNLGVTETGVVEAGDVYYAPSALRIAGSAVRLGASATGDVLAVTATARQVTVSAPANDAAWAVVGAEVEVTLPDRRTVSGKVVSATPTQAQAQPSGGQTTPGLKVVVDVPDQNALGSLDRSPVTVRYVAEKRDDVLSVPVFALVALAEGGYGLQFDDGRFVAVTTGLFADARVEVDGDGIGPGMRVRVPA